MTTALYKPTTVQYQFTPERAEKVDAIHDAQDAIIKWCKVNNKSVIRTIESELSIRLSKDYVSSAKKSGMVLTLDLLHIHNLEAIAKQYSKSVTFDPMVAYVASL